MTTILSFIAALSLLVFLHEGGHFLAARWCGVKVKRFAIGFGKPWWSWVDQRGTEWAFGWIPMGGYVSMVDEKEGSVAPEDLPFAYSQKSVGQRAFIIAAGPIANFVAAWFFLSIMLATPHQTWAPVLGPTFPASMAAKAGFQPEDKVISANGKPVRVAEDWQESLMAWALSTKEPLSVVVETKSGEQAIRQLPALPTPIQPVEGWIKGLGWAHVGSLNTTPVLESVSSSGPFANAGLKKGDEIVSIHGVPVKTWSELLLQVGQLGDKTVEVKFRREGQFLTRLVVVDGTKVNGSVFGRVGITAPSPVLDKEWVHLGFVDASIQGAQKTWTLTKLTVQGIGQLLTGQGSADQVSGPIGIAEHAGKSAERGWLSFVSFLAVLSVSLGVLNLLPVPILDGGHLVFLAVEKIKGTPVSIRVERLALSVGVFVIGSLTFMGVINDARKLLGI